MTDIRTWQQAVDYTFQTRHTWRHGPGRKTADINCRHFTRLRGASFPVEAITQPIISGVGIELEDEGKSDATINRVVSAVSTVSITVHSMDSLQLPIPTKKKNQRVVRFSSLNKK